MFLCAIRNASQRKTERLPGKTDTPYARLVLTIFNVAFLPSPGLCTQTGKCLFFVIRQKRTTIETFGRETTLNGNYEIQKVKRCQDICPNANYMMCTTPQMIPARKWSQCRKWSQDRNWFLQMVSQKKKRMAWTPWIVYGYIFSLIMVSKKDTTMKDGKNTACLYKWFV